MPHIVLVNPQIPPNTGNIARLCAALEFKLHLVHPLGFEISNRYLKRAGLDYWPHVDLENHDSFEALQNKYSQARFFYFTTKSQKSYTDVSYQKDDFLVFGPETSGLPESILKPNWDHALTIPMTGKVRSLNLSSAVAMVAGEVLRQVLSI